MSLSAKLSRSLLVLAPSTHVCSWVPPSAKNHSSRITLPGSARLEPLGSHRRALSSRTCPGAAAHILLHSPVTRTLGEVRPQEGYLDFAAATAVLVFAVLCRASSAYRRVWHCVSGP